MLQAEAVVILVTAGSAEEADRIAGLLIQRRVAACVNAIDGVRSLYWWQGEQESARETLLIVKTRAALAPEVIRLIKEAHSYTVPEVIALPIVGGNPDYLKWLEEETAEGKP